MQAMWIGMEFQNMLWIWYADIQNGVDAWPKQICSGMQEFKRITAHQI